MNLSSFFTSRINDKENIKAIFNNLFTYTSRDEIDKIDPDYFISALSETIREYTCFICFQVPLNPIQCASCLKIICKTCQKSIKCPFCRKDFQKKELDMFAKNVFESLKLECQNCKKYNKEGSKNLKVSEYLNHIKNCEFSDYKCLTCNKIIFHSKEKCYEHAQKCGFSDSICSYCTKIIKYYLLKEHQFKCGLEKLPCELCLTKIERKKIEDH